MFNSFSGTFVLNSIYGFYADSIISKFCILFHE